MAKRYISEVEGVPKSPSPISNAVVCGNICHISGQLSVYDEGYRPGTAREEAQRAFDLVFLIAQAAGFKRSDIVYVDIAFTNLQRDLPEVNALCSELFDPYPARTIYEAAALPFGAKIKVQAIAQLD
ncbi:RidA family protein [Altererythrobacter sp. BO-6]|nr:RidA family protein [Altererythrobacter sp. BO-6]